ncbi:MAG: TonB-dependent receptor [Hymenobacteraceae bacterium]|nr:TonB-dependent receptor [Hymenobacteraceae bacterium]
MISLLSRGRRMARRAAVVTAALLGLPIVGIPVAAQVVASAQVQQAPATLTTVPLKELLSQWETEYHVTILYESDLVRNKRVLTQADSSNLEEKLGRALTQAELQFKKLRDSYYLVLAAPSAAPVAAVSLEIRAQDVPVAGRVLQTNGEGLPGVTVRVKGGTVGTATDPDGRFALTVPEGSTLIFSIIGYDTKEVAVQGATTALEVSLATDEQALSEVVVVGYGTQERTSVTGAVSSVSGRDIVGQPLPDPVQALQGRAAGVIVTSNGGAPGGANGTSVRIRGITSAGNNAPPHVVDGFPLPSGDENQLNAINPNDIESFDVLKDASATAIYGVRAANGVVIITTKHGKAGKANITFDAYRGVQRVARRLDLLNAREYAVINNENRIAGGESVVPSLRDPNNLPIDTDWQDQVFRPAAAMQNYSLSATGGNEKARYALSAGYFQQDGTLIGSHFERFTVRANGDVQVNKVLKIGNNLSFTHLRDRQLSTGGDEFGIVSQALQIPATIPVYNADRTWYEPSAADNFIEPNPVVAALIADSKFTRNRLISTLFVELEPVKGLRFRTNVGTDLIFDTYNAFQRSLSPTSARYGVAAASASSTYTPSYLVENTITLDHLFADKHQMTLLVGQSAQEFDKSNVAAGRSGYTNSNLQNVSSGPLLNPPTAEGRIEPPARLASFFGRANYEFAGKYLFQAIARYDGSSAFQRGEKFGFFPGVSAGWRISEEEFLRNNAVVSNLKLRAGYGRVGNALNAGTFAYLYSINSAINYPFGPGAGTINTGAAPTRLANNQLKWEINEQINVGVDLGLWDNRVTVALDAYNRHSPNLIAPFPVTLVSGTYEPINSNAASAYNRGIDLSVTTRNLEGGGRDLTWTTTLVFGTYRSRLDKLNGGLPYNGLTARTTEAVVRYDEGQAFGSFYGFVADGLFQTPEDIARHATQSKAAPGDIRFRDVNADGIIDAADRTFIGSPVPAFTYGVTNTFAYGGFDLNVFVQGSQGNDIYNLNRFYTEGALYGNGSGTTRVLNRWTGPGTSTDVPRAVAKDPNGNLRVSSYYVEDGSYVRLKLLTLGYTLPKSILSRFGAQQVRVYASAQNLVTLTKYSGFDPEIGSSGVDRGVYPQSRTLIGGISVGF